MDGHGDLRIRIARYVFLFQTSSVFTAVRGRRKTPPETRCREPIGHWLSRSAVFFACMGRSKRSRAKRFASL